MSDSHAEPETDAGQARVIFGGLADEVRYTDEDFDVVDPDIQAMFGTDRAT